MLKFFQFSHKKLELKMFVRITNREDLNQTASSEAVMSLVCDCTVCLGLLGRQLVFDMGLDASEPVFRDLRRTKAQISLRIRAD